MSESRSFQSVAGEVEAVCADAGFDLVHPFGVAWYNDAVEQRYRLEDFGRPRALGLLIGNTRALWPVFIRAAEVEAGDADPLDRYAERVVASVVEQLGIRAEARYAAMSEPRLVALQRLADVTGFAYLSPSHLNIHPVYGPWFGMRAVISVDLDGPPDPPRRPAAPCECERHCMPAFRAATSGGDWTAWLAVRDSCPIGQEFRYGAEQIRYHYIKDRDLLAP